MHCYSLGHHCEDGGSRIDLVHERLFTSEEWDSLLEAAIVSAARKVRRRWQRHRRWAKWTALREALAALERGDAEAYASRMADHRFPDRTALYMSEVVPAAAGILCRRHGFAPLAFAQQSSFYDYLLSRDEDRSKGLPLRVRRAVEAAVGLNEELPNERFTFEDGLRAEHGLEPKYAWAAKAPEAVAA